MSTDSDMVPWLEERAASGIRIASNYHNITPAEYFRRWEPPIARKLEVARQQLARMSGITDIGLAVSAYNESELREAGYRNTVVTPLLVDQALMHEAPDSRLVERLRQSAGARWLFVGRLAPNKCQHDVVAAFAIYRRLYDPGARLTLIGSPSSYRYMRAVQRLASELGVDESVEFVSNLGPRQLGAYYTAADVFTCLSEHEGFCVPLLESMALGLPIVAYDAGAISETLAGAGVIIDGKDPLEVAVRVRTLLEDGEVRSRNVEAGRARARELSLESTAPQFLHAVTSWLEG
jgi:glycosyltransferase involved in cell wall biosynthesis